MRIGATVIITILAPLFCGPLFAGDQPNIIVIMADDLGYSDLGCYGGEIKHRISMPWREKGFDLLALKIHAAVPHPALLYSRVAMRILLGSGLWRKTGIFWLSRQLSVEAPTMAEILRPHGYATGIVGKWHQTVVGDSSQQPLYPLDRGFDFFYGTWWGAKDYFRPRFMMKNHQHIGDKNKYPDDFYLTRALSNSALEFVQKQIDQDRPFYLYLAHYAPHTPIQAPEDRVQDCFDRYKAGFETLQHERFARQLALGVVPENAKISAGMPSWNKLKDSQKREWATIMATYAAMIEIMDEGIGALIEMLKRNGQYDNSLILVFSDNGASPERKGKPPVSNLLAALSNTPYLSYKAHTFEGESHPL